MGQFDWESRHLYLALCEGYINSEGRKWSSRIEELGLELKDHYLATIGGGHNVLVFINI